MSLIPPEQRNASALQNTLRNIGLISAREYKNQVTQRSYMVISIIYLAVIIIGSFVPTIIQYIQAHTSSQSQVSVTMINTAGRVADMDDAALARYIETNLNGQAGGQSGTKFIVSTATAGALKDEQANVKNGKLDLLLVIERGANQAVGFTCYTANGTAGSTTQVQNLAGQISILDKAARQHLSSAQISDIVAQPQFTITRLQQVQDTRSTADIITGIILAYVGSILVYMAIMIYGNGVAQGVAEEKGSHIMEILVIAATPFQLMTGKIIGIGAAGLTQMAALVVVGAGMLEIQMPIKAALLGTTSNGITLSITGASITMLLLVLLYFVLAFALYSSLYAAVGALVSRQEEARNAGSPITLLFVVGYIVSVSIASIPDAPGALWVRIMSYVPFWSPTLMPLRFAEGYAAWWEILLTVALMLVAIPACSWISARIYRAGILLYGQRPRLGQLIKMARA